MSNLGDDLFASYRKYKGMVVDNPQYEPLESGVMSKDEIKKLKAREYAEKNKNKLKIKRLEKLIAELREENKTLKENNNSYVLVPDDFEALVKSEKELKEKVEQLEETNRALIGERESKADGYREENDALFRQLEKREKEFEEFKQAVRVIMKFI